MFGHLVGAGCGGNATLITITSSPSIFLGLLLFLLFIIIVTSWYGSLPLLLCATPLGYAS